MKRLTLTLALLLCSALVMAEDHTEAVYANSAWTMVPPDGVDHYILTPVQRKSALVTAWILSIDGNEHSLESKSLRAGCWLVSLPMGSVLDDPLSPFPASGENLEGAFLFRAPQTVLSWGPFVPREPYHLEAGEQLFLVTQLRNTGPLPLGTLSCIAQVYYRVSEP